MPPLVAAVCCNGLVMAVEQQRAANRWYSQACKMRECWNGGPTHNMLLCTPVMSLGRVLLHRLVLRLGCNLLAFVHAVSHRAKCVHLVVWHAPLVPPALQMTRC